MPRTYVHTNNMKFLGWPRQHRQTLQLPDSASRVPVRPSQCRAVLWNAVGYSKPNRTKHSNGLSHDKFYGSGARPRFYDLYRLVHRQKQTVDDDQALEEEEFTPRRLFLRDTLRRGVTPSPTLMRSKNDPYTLDLGKPGCGFFSWS